MDHLVRCTDLEANLSPRHFTGAQPGNLHRCLFCWKLCMELSTSFANTDAYSKLRLVVLLCHHGLENSYVCRKQTVGDSYVAAAGVPHARQDHAVVMARFAHDCLHTVCRVTEELEARLGPDTSEWKWRLVEESRLTSCSGDLSMRFGLHSGPVTAGVLRGERGRFQVSETVTQFSPSYSHC